MTIEIPLPSPSTTFAADIVGTSIAAPQSRLPRAKRASPTQRVSRWPNRAMPQIPRKIP